jgi:hypothetical protein
MSAKVDSSAVQDGYRLYHHNFLFTAKGSWAVVQQGMNEVKRYARRYHWPGASVADFVNEPHSAILSETRGLALNLTAVESDPARTTIAAIVTDEKPEKVMAEIKRIKTLHLPARHQIVVSDLHPDSLNRILLSTYERQPQGFEQLLGLSGVGPKTIRALSLISELIYGLLRATVTRHAIASLMAARTAFHIPWIEKHMTGALSFCPEPSVRQG